MVQENEPGREVESMGNNDDSIRMEDKHDPATIVCVQNKVEENKVGVLSNVDIYKQSNREPPGHYQCLKLPLDAEAEQKHVIVH